ncbi:MAG: HAMP domain-containing protein [Gammaproteobacteria bacterium]|nr:HAMP domain-containing protein [Gammaproteobacteria bacterium]MBI5617850.1 HAMP domain-containing protein [Gammaproteobacteria bacterium]
MEPKQHKKRLTLLAAVASISASLLGSLILMSAAIQNSGRFGALYSVLLILNCVGVLAFVVLIVINVRELVQQLRRQEPGAKLTLRMLVIFVVLAIAPVLILYGFSLDFLRRGVDNWFDVRIDRALSDALELSQASLDIRMRELLGETNKVAEQLAQGSDQSTPLDLNALRNPDSTVVANAWAPASDDLHSLRQRSGADEIALLTQQGRLLETSTVSADLVPHLPPEAILLQLRQGRSYIGLYPIRDDELYVRVAVNVPDGAVSGERRILHALYPIPGRLNKLADSVEDAYAKYHELTYLREKLKLSFAMTLTLVLLFSIVTAVWAAFYSARRLAAPIRDLAAGTAAVAAGNYETDLPVKSNDEIGFLVSSFNDMTRRIARARAEVETQHKYVNTLLSQLSSGVIALDPAHRIRTFNDSARRILDLGDLEVQGLGIGDLAERREPLRPFADGVLAQLEAPAGRWEVEIQIFSRSGRQVLMCRGTSLAVDPQQDGGHVVVFDDITALIKGQRDAAWSEVARRLAHEIKNPLTPIQLSAERLRQKYLPKMAAGEGDMLDRLTSTIVQQVDTMKSMVNTFSDYARPPKMTQEPTDVNELIAGVVALFHGANPHVQFTTEFAPGLPRVRADAGRLRQVFNNLIKNAVEASATGADAQIVVRTSKLESESGTHLEIRIEDRGAGIKAEILDAVFEPYVTNKTKGTGLGLAIVKKIVEEHGGVVTIENNPECGATAIIRLPLETEQLASDNILSRTAI